MKRTLVLVILIAFVAGAGFSYSGDARVRGMGGAFTAVADDINAITHNPAGLAYLTDTHLVVGLDVNVEMRKRLVYGEEEFPWVWEDYGGSTMVYRYWDEFLQTQVRFDPAEYGFAYDPEIPGDYERAAREYIEWRDAYDFYVFAENTSDMRLIPHVAYATRNWGFSTISDNAVDFLTGVQYFGMNTPIDVLVRKRTGVRGALGMGFGPLAVGGTAKFVKVSSYVLNYTADDMREGPPGDFMQQVLFGPHDGDVQTVERWAFELGVGGMFTVRALTVGAYLDNLLYFIQTDEDGTRIDAGLFDTLSLGVAWSPYFDRYARRRSPMNLIVAADFRNVGSHTNRELSLGVEAGINLGRVIMANVRGGYTQSLPGPLSEALDGINPYLGSYTMGFGWKFLVGEMNFAYTMPSDMMFDPPVGRLSEERLDTLFGTIVAEFRLSF